MVHNGPVDALGAVGGGVAELVRGAEHLVAIGVAGEGRGAHARGKGAVGGALPAALLAVRLAGLVEAAVVHPRLLRAADLRRDVALDGLQTSGSRSARGAGLTGHDIIERVKDAWQDFVLVGVDASVVVAVQLEEEAVQPGDVRDEAALNPVTHGALQELMVGDWERRLLGRRQDLVPLLQRREPRGRAAPVDRRHRRWLVLAGPAEGLPDAVHGLAQRRVEVGVAGAEAHARGADLADVAGLPVVDRHRVGGSLTPAERGLGPVPLHAVRADLPRGAPLLLQIEALEVLPALLPPRGEALHALALRGAPEGGHLKVGGLARSRHPQQRGQQAPHRPA
mmetsp:Transcript_91125/g.272021  ORF Transcript_91125/g.272021 Transcript_91125/m.272021 type:complete len:338 (-) Transcript_91125:37-1050(-)